MLKQPAKLPTLTDSDRKSVVRFSRQVISEIKGPFAVYSTIVFFLGALSLLPPQVLHYFSANILSVSMGGYQKFATQFFILGAVSAFCLAVSIYIRTLAKEWLQLKIEIKLKEDLIKKMHAMPLLTGADKQRGEWITKLTSDVKTAEDFLGTQIPDLIYQVVVGVFTGALLTYYTGALALFPIVTALAVTFLNVIQQRSLKAHLETMRSLHAGLFQVLLENLEGWKTIRSLGAAEKENNRVKEKLSVFGKKGIHIAKLIGIFFGITECLYHAILIASLGMVAYRTANGSLLPTQALIYPFYLGFFFFSLRGLTGVVNGWNRFLISGKRLYEFLETKVSADFSELLDCEVVRNIRAIESERLEVGIGREAIFYNEGISIAVGEVRTITGPSGAGKSTILEVLSGLRESLSGEVKFVGRDSKVLWEKKSTGEFFLPTNAISYVEQKPFFFEGSLLENLSLGISDIDITFAEELIFELGLHSTLEKRDGLQARLTDRGLNFSEGERYRLAIVRAFLQNRPFLFLDEPFAALDKRSASLVIDLFERNRHRIGVLLVTHVQPLDLKVDHKYVLTEKFNRFPSAPEISGKKASARVLQAPGGGKKQPVFIHG